MTHFLEASAAASGLLRAGDASEHGNVPLSADVFQFPVRTTQVVLGRPHPSPCSDWTSSRQQVVNEWLGKRGARHGGQGNESGVPQPVFSTAVQDEPAVGQGELTGELPLHPCS